MNLLKLAALFTVALLTSSCLTRDVSSRYASIIGKELPTLRDYYIVDSALSTGAWFNTHRQAWVVRSSEYAEQFYGFKPTTGLGTGKHGQVYTTLPKGTMLRVEEVLRHNLIDAGVETTVNGTMLHPVTKQKVTWAFTISNYGEYINRLPWEPDSVPSSRPTRNAWNAVHVLPQR